MLTTIVHSYLCHRYRESENGYSALPACRSSCFGRMPSPGRFVMDNFLIKIVQSYLKFSIYSNIGINSQSRLLTCSLQDGDFSLRLDSTFHQTGSRSKIVKSSYRYILLLVSIWLLEPYEPSDHLFNFVSPTVIVCFWCFVIVKFTAMCAIIESNDENWLFSKKKHEAEFHVHEMRLLYKHIKQVYEVYIKRIENSENKSIIYLKCA